MAGSAETVSQMEGRSYSKLVPAANWSLISRSKQVGLGKVRFIILIELLYNHYPWHQGHFAFETIYQKSQCVERGWLTHIKKVTLSICLLKAFSTKEAFSWAFTLGPRFSHFDSIRKCSSMLHPTSLTSIFQFYYLRMKNLHSGHISFKKWTIRHITQSSASAIGLFVCLFFCNPLKKD